MKEKKLAGRTRIDWDAARRDWRTGKYTQTELAAKHKVNPSTLNRKIKADQAADPSAWQQDLTEAVRLATNARVITEMVKADVKAKAANVNDEVKSLTSESQEKVKNAVEIAAEMGAGVILRHQRDLKETREVTMSLLAELRDAALLAEDKELLAEILAGGEDAKPDDLAKARLTIRRALDFGARISGVKSLTDALAKLQERERVAFSLDAKEKPPGEGDDSTMGNVEAANRIAFILANAKGRAAS